MTRMIVYFRSVTSSVAPCQGRAISGLADYITWATKVGNRLPRHADSAQQPTTTTYLQRASSAVTGGVNSTFG